jgi:acetyl esterase/lipase
MSNVRGGLLFATHDGVPLWGDLYTPSGPGPHPVVVAAPGGGWLRGDRTQLAHWGSHLAAHGIAVFVVDYRRSTDGRIFPGNAQDILAAAQFIHQRAADFSLDAERIGLLGASAGAHLAALVAFAGNAPVLAGGYPGDGFGDPPRFKALIGVYGPYDLAQHWRDCQFQPAESRDVLVDRMMGAALPDAEQAYRDGSPVTYVSASDAPPVLLIWGDSDTTVLPTQSAAFARALKDAGRSVETITLSGAGHFWFSKDSDIITGPNGQIADRLTNFLRRAFGLSPASR